MGKLFGGFQGWVYSFGRYAWDRMMAGMVIAGVVGGGACLVVAIGLESPVLLGVGFVVVVGHICFGMLRL